MATKNKSQTKAESEGVTVPSDATRTAEANHGSEIAAAISAGLKDAKGGNFQLKPDEGVEPRFTLVKNRGGEVMVRENETGHLSQIQLKSIEEKEASIQGQEVTEL